MLSDLLIKYADEYETACKIWLDPLLTKIAKIRKLPNGKYRVLSEKGKNLGTYDSLKQAKQRLRMIEFFKHKKAAKESLDNYSSIVRFFRDKEPELMAKFRKTFKEQFDLAYLELDGSPEDKALERTIELLKLRPLTKAAAVVELGDPQLAGRYLADVIRFVMRRISPATRPKSINNLRNKIMSMNEYEIAAKKMPASAAIGSSITLVKHLLLGHNSQYIREILNSIGRNL